MNAFLQAKCSSTTDYSEAAPSENPAARESHFLNMGDWPRVPRVMPICPGQLRDPAHPGGETGCRSHPALVTIPLAAAEDLQHYSLWSTEHSLDALTQHTWPFYNPLY